MGMVTPIWEEPRCKLSDPMTRITLVLKKQEPSHADSIRKHFEELSDSTLLFLRKIKRLSVHFYDSTGRITSSKVSTLEKPTSPTLRIISRTTRRSVDGNTMSRTTTKHLYHVTRKMVSALPKSDSRNYQTEKSSRLDSNSEAVLAFPTRPGLCAHHPASVWCLHSSRCEVQDFP